MKFYNHILSVALMSLPVLTFVACDDDENEISYPATLEIVTSSGSEFAGEGGTLDLLVNSNVDYTVSADVDWIAQTQGRSSRPLNGKLTFVVSPYEAAMDMTPRTGNITLAADGVESATFTVKQVPGELYKFEITSEMPAPVSFRGGEIRITFDTNLDYTVSASDPSWISVNTDEPGVCAVAVAENTVAEPRQGSVTFHTVELGDFPVEFSQDPYNVKGISTAQDMLDFAAAVNAGSPLDQWTDENQEVVLLSDIDLSGCTWTPIGNITGSTITNNEPVLGSGNAFKGVFNGNGHTIRNLAMVTDNAQCLGLFGVCDGATVKNLNIDASCTLQVVNENITCGSMYGFVAAMMLKGTMENVKVSGTVRESLMYMEATKYFACLSGVVAFTSSSTIRNCTFDGLIERVRSNIYDNSTGSCVSAVVGFARGDSKTPTLIENCTNAGYVYAQTHRVGGILARTPGNFILRGCVNSGVVHASAAEAAIAGWTSGLRVGGVFAFSSNTKTSAVATVESCTNTGTVVCEGDASTIVGALCGNPRCHTLTDGVNSGTLITTGGCIAGLIIGQVQCSDKPTIVSARCGGRVATAFSGTGMSIAPVDPVTITADNYFSCAAGGITGTNSGIWTTSNVTFLGQ